MPLKLSTRIIKTKSMEQLYVGLRRLGYGVEKNTNECIVFLPTNLKFRSKVWFTSFIIRQILVSETENQLQL